LGAKFILESHEANALILKLRLIQEPSRLSLTAPEPKRLTLEPWRPVLELSGTNMVRSMDGL
jgi:hypothetical protein